MGTNDDFYAKELNLNYFYMHSNSEQKYPKTAIVSSESFLQLLEHRAQQQVPKMPPKKQNVATKIPGMSA